MYLNPFNPIAPFPAWVQPPISASQVENPREGGFFFDVSRTNFDARLHILVKRHPELALCIIVMG